MKKIITLAVCALMLTVLLLSMPTRVAAEDGGEPAWMEYGYYGRGMLATGEYGDNYLYTYDAILEGILKRESRIDLDGSESGVGKASIVAVMDAIRNDRPDIFWLGGSYGIGSRGADALYVTPEYFFDGYELENAKAAVEHQVSEILAEIDPAWSDFEKAVHVYDLLIARITYDLDAPNAHNIYGALVTDSCVCEGYAEAFQYILQRLGIHGYLAHGSSISSGELHEWNYIYLNGAWSHFDPTWDDTEYGILHGYFGLSDAQISVDHAIKERENNNVVAPVCNSTANNYFTLAGLKLTAPYSVSKVASLMKGNNRTLQVEVDDHDAFMAWFKENGVAIHNSAGVSGDNGYLFMKHGLETWVRFNGSCGHASGSSYIYVPARAADCDTEGYSEHYECPYCSACFLKLFGLYLPADRSKLYSAPTGHAYTVQNEAKQFLRNMGDCTENNEYWYQCATCQKSAGIDPSATDKFYTGTTLGDHSAGNYLISKGGEHFYTCEVCGTHLDTEECHGGEATCTSQAVCEVCRKPYGELLPHTPDTEGFALRSPDGHARECTVCHSMLETVAHSSAEGGEATDDTPELCLECGYIMTPALTHGDNHTPREEWQGDELYHWHGCIGCEEQMLERGEHTDTDADFLCDVCAREVDPNELIRNMMGKLTEKHLIFIGIGAALLLIFAAWIKIASIRRRIRRRR